MIYQQAREPGSLQFKFGRLQRAWFRDNAHQPVRFGYRLPFTVNGRNAFGGMTGPVSHEAWFEDGRIINLQRRGSSAGRSNILRGIRHQRRLYRARRNRR
jgi:hypothetical protein